jgi:hypothetical protein
VAVCVIARDEEQFIGKCVDSVRPFVDEVIVMDTGSTDQTREIARAHGARVEEFVWCDDFAAARNAAIDAATTDWILMLDADEELDPSSGPLLKPLAAQLPEGAIAYAISIENRHIGATGEAAIWHAVNRFIPRRAEIRYQGAIHEDVCFIPDPARSMAFFAPTIRAVHYGYDPGVYAAKSKDARNMKLLESEIERNPASVRMLYHLGQQHQVAGRYRESAEVFEQFVQRAGDLASYYRVDGYRLWLDCLIALGDEEGVTRVAHQAETAGELSALARETLALQDLRNDRLTSAKRHLLCALDPDVPMGIANPPGAGGWRSRLLLAEAYDRLGEGPAALATLHQAFVELPLPLRYRTALQGAQLAKRMRQPETNRWLEYAAQTAPDELEAHQALLHVILDTLRGTPALVGAAVGGPLERALAAADWQAAYELAVVLPLGTHGALARILFLVDQLRQKSAPEAALDLLGRAIDVHEPSRPLYWPLMQILKDLDRFDDALAAIEVLRTLPEEPLKAAA